ncbi:MAG: mannosyltransferase [Thermoleophilaceae bacterium]|nr:mannosyltransferase [Thermoleophilaceae bacterium]
MRLSEVRCRTFLLALVGVAAVLRFGTLGQKGLWGDEISTAWLVQGSYPDLLHSVARLESTPPLYYSLAWVWAKLFGTGAFALRSLPALLGVATVPITYFAARRLVSRQTAVMAAGLIAVNPLLVWYSQEARSYALLVFLSALGLWCFARALDDPGAGRLLAWAVVSGAALATHYFAVFLVLPEAFVLMRESRRRRAVAPALAIVCLAGGALLPLALHQRSFGHADWIAHNALIGRVAALPGVFAAGFDAPSTAYIVAGGLLALGAAYIATTRGAESDRRGGTRLAGLGLTALAVPVVLAVLGADYFSPRNSLAAIVPLAIALSVGLRAPGVRAARVATVTVFALSLTIVVATAGQPKYHSEDWRGAVEDLPHTTVPRAIVATPGQPGRKSLKYYLGATSVGASTRPRVREVDVVALPRQGSSRVDPAVVSSVLRFNLRGFHRTELHRESDFVLLTLRAQAPTAISALDMERRVGGRGPMVVHQTPRAG